MQPNTQTDSYPPFLAGSGEMRRLTRSYNWAATTLGAPERWPLSLRTLLQMMFASRFPMLIFWGKDLITFYNDAFRPSLGNDGKHPGSLGQRGEQSWAESWPVIGPMIHNIMDGGEAVWFEDQKLPIYREGGMGYAYWTYSFSPVHDDAGAVAGVLVTCSETTKAVESLQRLEEAKEQQELAIEAALLGTFDLNPATGLFTANSRLKDWFGLGPDDAIALPVAVSAIAPADRERVSAAIALALTPESGGRYEEEYTIVNPRTGAERVVLANGRAQFNDEQQPVRLSGTLRDITQQARRQQEKSDEQRSLLALFEQSAIGIAIIVKEGLTFTLANPFYGVLVDRRPEEIVGKPLLEALPEIAGQGFDALLNGVIETGVPFVARDVAVDIRRGAAVEKIYVDLAYQPMREQDGTVSGVLVIATDVTQSVRDRQAIEASEAKFRALITEAPFPTALYVGEALEIELANEPMIRLWGKTPAVIGQTLEEALPELEGQPFFGLLREVLRTGIPYSTHEQAADLVVDGLLQRFWFNFTYKPLFDEHGKPYAVLNMAVDVSAQVQARRTVEEAELNLRTAIDVARLATWQVDAQTMQITCSGRLGEWLGVPEGTLGPEALEQVVPADRQRLFDVVRAAMAPGSSGAFDDLYTVENSETGHKRIIHVNGKTLYGPEGKPIALLGTAQDVTLEQQMQLALEQEVQYRTEALETAVEELRATNEDMELLNRQLYRSNEELAQYAYVTSHDLQEPLRKIRLFSSMLANEQQSPAERQLTVGRITRSADRMSLLIRDLLEFSRLLHSERQYRPVDLGAVVASVSEDYELVIVEKAAQLSVGSLPTIEGIGLQLNQLFANLVGNALKFTAEGRTPEVKIQARPATEAELLAHLPRAHPGIPYFVVTVADNGIGFDPENGNRVFEVFRRLHSHHEYSGTGIGLAICRRVVFNHGGAIWVEAAPGIGAQFHVLLPERQEEVPEG